MHRLAALFAALSCVSLGLLGCGWDYTPSDNLLPNPTTQNAEEEEEAPLETSDTGEGEGELLPATYRFNCVDIKSVGDADESVFQVVTLQNTWAADIANYKLNILIDLLAEDAELGTGAITIRSGVGPNAANQCSQGEAESAEFEVGYAPAQTQWTPGSGQQCALPATSGGAGTLSLDMGPEERVLIYAEDDDGTPFNCSLDAGSPNAIPIWAVDASISLSTNRSSLAGSLSGCVVVSDAASVCSCLSVCTATAHPDCGGCPTGSIPLSLLLGGVNPTPNCSDLMGEPALDITLEFSAARLGSVPTTCGG